MNTLVLATANITSGNTDVDATIVIVLAAIVGMGVLAGTGSAIKAGTAVFNKVMKYFGKAL